MLQIFKKKNFQFSEIEINLRSVFFSQGNIPFKEQGIKVLSVDETIDLLAEGNHSLARFGDGDIALMARDYGEGYQDKNESLADRLLEVFTSNNPEVLIGLPDQLISINNSVRKSRKFWLIFLANYSNYLLQLLKKNHRYANTNFSRFYMTFSAKKKAPARFERLKKIWKEKEILIVEGEFTRSGVGNDLFSKTKGLKRIICPAKNAWDRYEQIFYEVKRFGKNKLILLALGPTATVMAFDLSRAGYWAIDMGHLDVEYMWMLNKAKEKTSLAGRYVNESSNNVIEELESSVLEQYNNEIVTKILH